MAKRIFLILCVFLLCACSRQADRPALSAPTLAGDPEIQIDTVQVTQAVGLRVSGTANLAATDCLRTGLWIDDQPAAWWPQDVCVQPDAGAWEMVVALGQKDAPPSLDPQSRYEIRAWPANMPDRPLARYAFRIETP